MQAIWRTTPANGVRSWVTTTMGIVAWSSRSVSTSLSRNSASTEASGSPGGTTPRPPARGAVGGGGAQAELCQRLGDGDAVGGCIAREASAQAKAAHLHHLAHAQWEVAVEGGELRHVAERARALNCFTEAGCALK